MNRKKQNLYRLTEDELFRLYHLEREEHFIPIPSLGIRVRVQVTGAEHAHCVCSRRAQRRQHLGGAGLPAAGFPVHLAGSSGLWLE
ncbi:MAG: hypothetical protein Q9P14_08635 [candidate division KSB1 bacterium]|nr:hypothetical protein [candidate division KSB1 bacterium]